MPVTTRQLNQLEKQVMQQVFTGERLFSYWTTNDFVYVTKFNEVLLIHYRMIFNKGYLVIKWCLTGERNALEFKPQLEGVIMKPMLVGDDCKAKQQLPDIAAMAGQ